MRDGGAGFNALMAEMGETLAQDAGDLSPQQKRFEQAREQLRVTADFILAESGNNAFFEGAVAFNFLMQFGYVLGAWYHLRSALIAQQNLAAGNGDRAFLERKITAAEFYSTQMLPRAMAYSAAVEQGAPTGCALTADSFA